MVSSTAQTETRRHHRKRTMGRKSKKLRHAAGTPKFPIQPDGYDKKAPDAKPASDS